MKHFLVDFNKTRVINQDGHAIGLDIGATGVRAAVLSPGLLDGRPSVTIQQFGHMPLAPGTVINGVVSDQAALTAALKRLWHEQKLEGRNVILGIANQQVLVRDMEMPNVTPEQMAKALPFQARDIAALPIDQVVLDFTPLGEPDPETNMVRGLLLVTPRQPVLAAVHAVERAGLKVARVDLSSFAALRSIADAQVKVEAVVDLGAHLTTIVIHDHGVPKLVRTIVRGGQELTERVAERVGMDLAEAEAAKVSIGLDGNHSVVARVLNETLRPLLGEIRTSIGYFRKAYDGVQLERISLTGGASLLPGLANVLAEQTELPTRIADPMQHISNRYVHRPKPTPDAAFWSTTAVSLGLGMGAAA